MSSDEEELTSPVLPKDSDPGSSVSSELQDEYEELLRYAVVTPRHETITSALLHQLSPSHLSAEGLGYQRNDGSKLHLPADRATEQWRPSNRTTTSPHNFSLIVEPPTHTQSRASRAEEMAARTPSRVSAVSELHSDRLQTVCERSRPNSPCVLESAIAEMFISEQRMSKMENILDTWSHSLKSNVLTELRKWKLAFMEQHNLEMKKERERHAAQTADLKELLQTYETSNQRKDQVIVNLSQVLDSQKEKLEKMRSFTHWRLKHVRAKEEAHAAQVAQQHYNMQLKKKVWTGWHSLIQKHWKVRVERACRSRAEEVCSSLSSEYEAKLAEHCEAIEKAQAEIHRLRLEREQYEESIKKAFMRGVCALNMEALNMFHTAEGRPEQPAVPDQNDPPPPQAEPRPAMVTVSSTRISPVHFDRADPPSHSDGDNAMGFGARTEIQSSFPLGGPTSSHKQASGRTITASQQKPSKTVTARITARPDISKAARSNLQVMGVAPPMSSVIVERHHPVTQLTVGQATAARFPRSSQPGPTSTGGKSSSRTHSTTCHVHSIKVVD